MSVQGSNQSMASPMNRVRSQLECPVCYNIPRDLPLPSCPSGHFVCRPCKTKVKDCPTCRQPMPANMTNSAIGALIEQVEHDCKFTDQGCGVKMMLKDLVTHEKTCPDRTIQCPNPGCAQLVKLKNFDNHAQRGNHSLIIDSRCNIRFKILRNNVVPRVHWPLGCFYALDEIFYLTLAYHKPSKCFVISILVAKSQDVASKYKANVNIKGDNNELCFNGINVSSVENAPSVEQCIEETGTISLCLQRNLAKSLSVKKQEEGFGIVEYLNVGVSFERHLNVDAFALKRKRGNNE